MIARTVHYAIGAALAALLLLATGGQAQTPLSQKAAEAAEITAAAQQNGYVRVIVMFEPPVPANQLKSDATSVANARARVAAAQDGILSHAFRQRREPGARRRLRPRHHPLPHHAGFRDQCHLAELEALAADARVTRINHDRPQRHQLTESVPLIGMTAAYTLNATGAGQAVAVLDTGVKSNHEFLTGKVVAEACFSNGFPNANRVSLCPNGTQSQTGAGAANADTAACINGSTNLCQHGSHVAGIAAGFNTNQQGGEPPNGVAKDGKIFAVQIFTRFNAAGDCTPDPAPCVGAWTSDQVLALDHVFSNINLGGGTVVASVNMSLGGGLFSGTCDGSSQKPAIDNLRGAGVLTAIASGNDGSRTSGPLLARGLAVVHRIACDHMSGLLSRPYMTAAKMVSATRVPNRAAAWDATGSRGVSRVLGSIDHTNCSVSSKLPALPAGQIALPAKRLCLPRCRGCVSSHRCHGEGGAEREALSKRSAPLRPRRCRTLAVIVLATDHQFPDDARSLVGERDGGQLRRLARKQRRQPGRATAAPSADLLDDRRGPDHKGTPQRLVAGTCDHAKPLFAGRGMVLGREPQPSCKVAAGSEGAWIGHLHDQQGGGNRADPGDLHQALARFVLPLPSTQPPFEAGKPHPELGIVRPQRGEHLLGEVRQPGGGDPRQQGLDLVEPFGCHQPELGGIPADGIAQLRATRDELVAHPHQHQGGLLLGGFHRHRAHARPAHGFADPIGVGRVVLVARDIGLHQLRRQQHRLVPQRPDLPRPVMSSTTGFHPHPRRRQLPEELQHLVAPQLLAQHRALGRINPVQLKNTLGRVHTDAHNLGHGRLPRLRSPTTSFWHSDAVGGRPPQQISSPACISSAVAVGSTTETDTVSFFSNMSSVVDLLAPGGGAPPGTNILSSVPVVPSSNTTTYSNFQGTSMAAPHVAGAIAAVRAACPNATADAIETALKSTGTPVTDTRSGGSQTKPRIRVDLAVQSLNCNVPANDNFANAITIQPGATLSGTNVNATKETGEPNHAGNAGGKSVWWKFTPASSGQVKVSTANSSFNTLLAVYTGSAVNALTLVASNNDTGGAPTSYVSFSVVAGTPYSIAVDGFNGATGTVSLSMSPPNADLSCGLQAQMADFNGDGKTDILTRHTDGGIGIYLMNGFQSTANQIVATVDPQWKVVGSGDFNGDGKADFLMRHTDGTLAIYLINGLQVIASQAIGAVGNEWIVVGVGDFNGDGKADFMTRRSSDGAFAIYLMNGFQNIDAQIIGTVDLQWKVVGVGDFNGDHKSDFVLRHTDGTIAIYLMNGFQILASDIAAVIGNEWTFSGVADFDANGKSDFVNRRFDGAFAIFLMNGTQFASATIIGAVGNEWVLLGVGDFNGDGKADFINRRSTDASIAIFLMNVLEFSDAQIIVLPGC